MNSSNNNQKKSDQFLDEIISPIFGHDYQNRVVASKNEKEMLNKESQETSYLEKQIEEKVEAQTKIAKAKEYQETLKTNTDVLKQYHKQKEDEELKAALPSNSLNFLDSLEKTSQMTTNSDFNFSLETEQDFQTSTLTSNTISEILDEVFDK